MHASHFPAGGPSRKNDVTSRFILPPLCFVESLRFPKTLSYLTTFFLFERRGAVLST
jgi:hypothetical protein